MLESQLSQGFYRQPNLRLINFHNANGGTSDNKTCFVTNVEWLNKLENYRDKSTPLRSIRPG